MMMTGSTTRTRYCGTENYDTCPLFLSRMLRKARYSDHGECVAKESDEPCGE
jgi:hypothetical protein